VRSAEAAALGDADLDEHLGRLDARHVRTDVELVHLDDALRATGSAQDGLALERHDDAREVLGRVGLTQRAAHRSAVADHRIGQHCLGLAEDVRELLVEKVGLEHVDVARQRPHGDVVPLVADVVELALKRVDVDDVARVGEAQLHHWDEAVPARQDARVAA
jgi:hypothetical protein